MLSVICCFAICRSRQFDEVGRMHSGLCCSFCLGTRVFPFIRWSPSLGDRSPQIGWAQRNCSPGNATFLTTLHLTDSGRPESL